MSITWNCRQKLLQSLSWDSSTDWEIYKRLTQKIAESVPEQWCLCKAKTADWGILKGCFAEEPRVDGRTGDIDGFVHQANSVLFLEKKTIGTTLSIPLVRAFNTLAAQGNAAIAVWYDAPDASDMTMMRVWGLDGYNNEFFEANLNDFRVATRTWWRANYQGYLNADNELDNWIGGNK